MASDAAPHPRGAQGRAQHSAPVLAKAYASYIGRDVSQADLARIAEAITAQYKAKGYALSRAFVPPQDIQDGRVVVQVAEGHVSDVVIDGLGGDWFIARDILDPITRERPLRIATLERQMLLLSDLPGIQIKDASVKELGTGSGHFRLTVQAQFFRAIASLDMDNRGSRTVGPWQSFNTVALNSVLRRGDTLIVNGATVANDPRQLGYIGTIYENPHRRERRTARSATDLQRGLASGAATHGGRPHAHAGLHVLRVHPAVALARDDGEADRGRRPAWGREVSRLGQHYEDHVSALSAAIDVVHQDRFSGTTVLSVTGRQGITAFGASGSRDLTTSRPGADSEFTRLSALAVRYQALTGPFSLMLATAAQVTSGPVVRSEAFGFGGSFMGRAFAPSTFIGDNGLAGLAELRFDQTLDAAPMKGYQLYAFVDRGVLWMRDASDTIAAGSWGGGYGSCSITTCGSVSRWRRSTMRRPSWNARHASSSRSAAPSRDARRSPASDEARQRGARRQASHGEHQDDERGQPRDAGAVARMRVREHAADGGVEEEGQEHGQGQRLKRIETAAA